MKKIFLFLTLFVFAVTASFASTFETMDPSKPLVKPNAERVSFRIKGTGSKNIMVTIGIGYQPGSGACCSGVSPNTTASFVGDVGDVVYDGKTRRVITKIYKELNGTTIDLAEYY